MYKKLIIAIDGPSGAGKSTLSKALADKLEYLNIDTGAMYRSVALMAQRQKIDSHDEQALKKLCADLSIRFVREKGQERIIVNEVDVSDAIRTPEVSLLTAKIASCSSVREAMLDLQRQMGQEGGVVLEGRDIGTVVFPSADVKFFLSATAEQRGLRRYKELKEKGIKVDLQQTIADVESRDKADTARTLAPLMQADDAIVVDSTQLTIVDVLQKMLVVVEAKQAEAV